MEIQVATLCDAATDYNGKLCVLGTFDHIFARQMPAVHPQCALALRVCFLPGDEGTHKLSIAFINADGQPVFPPIEPTIGVQLPANTYFITRNFVINLQGLKFDQPGQYAVRITLDGHEACAIPLNVALVPNQGQA